MTDKKTIRVRIAVAVDKDGNWCASGWTHGNDDARDIAIDGVPGGADACDIYTHWIEADVPLPESVTIEGKVQP